MYLHAWKSGLKTTYYLRSRPATRIQQATVPVMAQAPAADEAAARLLPGEPRDLRGLPVTLRSSCCSIPGMDLTLRPMRYPHFFDRFRDAIKNTWTVEEVDLHSDLADLAKLSPAERHLVTRLVAFFATGDTIVANNLVLNLYQHVNSPEARLYLSRQLFEEAVHVQFYLTLLDTYVPDEAERAQAFAAVENIPSIRRKAEFCFRWIDSLSELRELRTAADRRAFLLNLICFAACIEGLFFYGAFAYVYFLRSRGLLQRAGLRHQLGVPRRVDAHGVRLRRRRHGARRRSRTCSTTSWRGRCGEMLAEAVECEVQFAEDLLGRGVSGHVAWPTCASTCSTSPTGGWPSSASSRCTARPTRSPSWSCRTCRSCPTSSSAGSRPTRSASPATVSFDDDF